MSQELGAGGGVWGRDELTTKGKKEVFEKVGLFYIFFVVVVTQLYEFVKIHRTIHQKGRIFNVLMLL